MAALPKIAHIIVRLDTGGAERSLMRLVRGTKLSFEHTVVCFGPVSDVGRQIAEAGVDVVYIDYRLGPVAFVRAGLFLRKLNPAIIQGWMYFGNVLASLLVTSFGGLRDTESSLRSRLAWNIRQAPADFRQEKWTTRAAMRIGAWSLLRPDLVIYNSNAGQLCHEHLGYNQVANAVITNGIDTEVFKPDADIRRRVRDSLLSRGNGPRVEETAAVVCESVSEEPQVVALVCRYHPLKGVSQFLQAVHAVLQQETTPLVVVVAGPGMEESNSELQKLVVSTGLVRYQSGGQLRLLGKIDSLENFLPGLDLLVLASLREGTPNILLEAMACGINSIATRVGDVAEILRDESRLVEPDDVDDLVAKICVALNDNKEQRSAGAATMQTDRDVIVSNYSLIQCMTLYQQTYRELIAE